MYFSHFVLGWPRTYKTAGRSSQQNDLYHDPELVLPNIADNLETHAAIAPVVFFIVIAIFSVKSKHLKNVFFIFLFSTVYHINI